MNRTLTLATAGFIAAVSLTPALAAQKKHHHRHYAPAVIMQHNSVDTVGSLADDGRGYAYNRVTGQRYSSCVIDEGYGRVSSCDSGYPR